MLKASVNGRQELAAWAYGVALIMLFTISTLFHVFSWHGNFP
jgi:channel protein (hemolysin III family)